MSWLTITEAAEMAGVSAKTIRRRLKSGEFPTARQDGEGHSAPWLIPRETLDAQTKVERSDDGPVIELREQLQSAEMLRVEVESRLREEISSRERADRELQRSRSDLEEERTARERAEREAIEARARAEEREKRIIDLVEDRDRERGLVEMARAGRVEVEERLRAELAEVQSVIGWRARRRLSKVQGRSK